MFSFHPLRTFLSDLDPPLCTYLHLQIDSCGWVAVSARAKVEGREMRLGFARLHIKVKCIPGGVFTATTEHSVKLALAGLGFLCRWFGHVMFFWENSTDLTRGNLVQRGRNSLNIKYNGTQVLARGCSRSGCGYVCSHQAALLFSCYAA